MPFTEDSQIPDEPRAAVEPLAVPDTPQEDAGRRTSLGLGWILELLILLVVAWVAALVIRTWVIQPFVIPSASMENTLQIDDRVLVSKFVYHLRQPTAGDVVVFLSPDGDSRDYIKRVVAVGGQTVEIRHGAVYVDGAKQLEPFTDKDPPDEYTGRRAIHVPAGYVFLMGDNRANSRDSRYFGPQPVSRILGEAFMIYWPLSRVSTL